MKTIYKLFHPVHPEIYIGSTLSFRQRKIQHKHDCNTETGPYYDLRLYRYIREHGGWNQWKFMIIKEVPDDSDENIKFLESQAIEEHRPTLNIRKAYKNGPKPNPRRYQCSCGGKYTEYHGHRHFDLSLIHI